MAHDDKSYRAPRRRHSPLDKGRLPQVVEPPRCSALLYPRHGAPCCSTAASVRRYRTRERASDRKYEVKKPVGGWCFQSRRTRHICQPKHPLQCLMRGRTASVRVADRRDSAPSVASRAWLSTNKRAIPPPRSLPYSGASRGLRRAVPGPNQKPGCASGQS